MFEQILTPCAAWEFGAFSELRLATELQGTRSGVLGEALRSWCRVAVEDPKLRNRQSFLSLGDVLRSEILLLNLAETRSLDVEELRWAAKAEASEDPLLRCVASLLRDDAGRRAERRECARRGANWRQGRLRIQEKGRRIHEELRQTEWRRPEGPQRQRSPPKTAVTRTTSTSLPKTAVTRTTSTTPPKTAAARTTSTSPPKTTVTKATSTSPPKTAVTRTTSTTQPEDVTVDTQTHAQAMTDTGRTKHPAGQCDEEEASMKRPDEDSRRCDRETSAVQPDEDPRRMSEERGARPTQPDEDSQRECGDGRARQIHARQETLQSRKDAQKVEIARLRERANHRRANALNKSDARHSAFRNTIRLGRRNNFSKLPETAEEHAAPLHVAHVPPLRPEILRARLSSKARARFDNTWASLCDMSLPQTSTRDLETASWLAADHESRLSANHAWELQQHDIAEIVDAENTDEAATWAQWNVGFTVSEEKATGLRQRFILWTCGNNEAAAERGYVADLPLPPVATHLREVLAEVATTRDLRCGFFGIEIPAAHRNKFAFRDAEGNLWRMRRAPMGAAQTAEVLHTLLAAAAGDPAFAAAPHTEEGVVVSTWIDNLRLSGSADEVHAATERLEATAAAANLSWKPEDSHDGAQSYEFLGVHYDHAARFIRPGKKQTRRLREVLSWEPHFRPTCAELEQLLGRLMHASAAGLLPLCRYWWAVKFLRRVGNQLARGARSPTQRVAIPRSVRSALLSWAQDALAGAYWRETSSAGRYLFVDASLEGFGAVIAEVGSENPIVLGARFSTLPEAEALKGAHINVLEAVAWRQGVRALPEHWNGSHVVVLIDNTTVQGAGRKRFCNSQEINRFIRDAVEELSDRGISWEARWIASAENPADLPSRVFGPGADTKEVSLAVGKWLVAAKDNERCPS